MNTQIIRHKTIKSPFGLFAKSWFESSKSVSGRSKFKSIIISLLIGLIIGFFVLWITTKDVNPFSALASMMQAAFGAETFDFTLATTAFLIMSGIANAIAFKAGLFNIGVSGQMFFSGGIAIILALKVIPDFGYFGLVFLIFVGMLIGGLVAGFTGWVKAKFNVHEVVTSILLNWALFYLVRYFISIIPNMKDSSASTTTLPSYYQISIFHVGLIIFVTACVVALLVSVFLWKSTAGYAMKATGLSKDATEYAGINVNKQIMLSMTLSGLVAGLLGVMTYVMVDRQISSDYLTKINLPQIGFEGIAVALLAFSNPIAVIPVAFFFGVVSSGSTGLSEFGVDLSFGQLITGVIMYLAAIAILFMRFKPIELLYTWFRIRKYRNESQLDKENKEIIDNFLIFAEKNNLSKEKIQIGLKNIRRLKKTKWRLFKQEHLDIYNVRTHFYNKVVLSDRFKNIQDWRNNINSKNKTKYSKEKARIKSETVSAKKEYLVSKTAAENRNVELKNIYEKQLHKFKIELKSARFSYKTEKNNIHQKYLIKLYALQHSMILKEV